MVGSDNEQVIERTPRLPVVLDHLSEQLLDEAASAGDGRAALTLTPSEGARSKQTLVAVRSGRQFGPELWPGHTSIQVIRGAASVPGAQDRLTAGSWTLLSEDDAPVTADEDLVALLTVDGTE